MKIGTIASVIAAALLTAGFVPASSAQDNSAQHNNGSAPDGIEVITIIGKRVAPTMANACVNAVMARTAATGKGQHEGVNSGEEALDTSKANMINVRRAIRHCIEQAAAPAQVQI